MKYFFHPWVLRYVRKYEIYIQLIATTLLTFTKHVSNFINQSFIQVNHHFLQNNSVFQEIEHPRWGAIMGVLTTKDIKAGQELFAHYGYTSTTFPSDVPWYWEQKRKIEKNERSKSKRTKT